VIAVGSGEGDLLAVSLELPDDCHDKHVEPLAIAPVYVHVNLDTAKRERNNNNVFKVNNNNNNSSKSSSANNSGKRNRKKGEQQQQQHRRQQHGMDSIGSNSNNYHGMSSMKSVDMGDLSEILSNIALRDDNSRDNADRGPPYRPPAANNPGGQPSYYGGSASGGSNGFSLHPHETATTLEVGMYILLGVFCVAIAVFMASCFVYASKQNNSRFLPSAAHHHPGLVMMQQQHHSNHHKSRSVQNAHDWVWLGRQSTTLDGSKLSGCPSLATSGSRDDGLLAAGETATAASSSLLSREYNRRDRPPGGGYYLRDPTSRPPHFGGFVNGRWIGGGERNYNNDVHITANPGEMYADERLGGDFEYEQRRKEVASGAVHDFYAELPRHHHHSNSNNGNHHRRSPRAHRREQRRRQQQDNGSVHSGGHSNNRSVESMLLLQQQQQYQQQQQEQQQHQLLSRSTFMAAVQKSPESSQQQQQQQQQRQQPQLKQARASSSPSSSSPSSPSVRHWGNQNIPLGNRVINNNNNNNNEEEEEVTSPNSSVQSRPSINSATYTRQKPVLAGAGAILPVGYPIFSVRGGSAAAAPLGSSGGFQNPWEALHHRGNGRNSFFPREKQTADRHFFQVKLL
jgi:hypothetical protein